MKINVKTFHNARYVYTYSNETGVLYVGAATLKEIISFKAIRHYPDFNDGYTYSVDIQTGPHDTHIEAMNALGLWVRMHLPEGKLAPFNYGLLSHKSRRGRVVDTSTGATYESATAACEALGIAQSRMSCHLNGYKGHKTIGGRIFIYERAEEGESAIHPSRREPLKIVAPHVPAPLAHLIMQPMYIEEKPEGYDMLTDSQRNQWQELRQVNIHTMTKEENSLLKALKEIVYPD